jgi:hypothetical protein
MRCFVNALAVLAVGLLGGCAGYYPPAGYPQGGYAQAGYPRDYPQGGYAQGYPATQGVVRCESDDGNTRRCAADTRGGVRLSRKLSRTECVQGRNWGYDAGGIWVGGGCRAEFVVGDAYANGAYGNNPYGNGAYGSSGYGQQTIRCESEDGRERHCAATLRGAALQQQLSRAPCVQGRNWRWDRDGVWVKDGCRAEFTIW